MPLVRIDIIKGKSTEYKKQVLECVHAGLEEALGIPYMLCLLSRKKSRKDHSAIYQLLYSWIMNMFIP